ncbi:MAG: PilZ domain-containing protein [Solidesulfovibrio sp. DCME]|uniref:PilZ domain-containing protein n=1 Tax=Solidesulfovibrio sp. DCME TaxID=3447380 RepID=UPI003D0E0CFE
MNAHAKTSRRLMEEAIAQRARCFLALPEPITGLGELLCAILESSSRGLMLESVGKAACGPHWAGLPVTGFFRVKLRRGQAEETFYTFDSRIREAAPGRAGTARLVLDEPRALVFGQRRKSLRLEPESGQVKSAFLWRYDKGEGFTLNAPSLRDVDFRSGQARLADISAGGLRLALRAALLRQRPLELPKGQRVVVHLELNEPRLPGEHDFWIVARVRHLSRDDLSGDRLLGLEFLASGQLDHQAGKIRWQPVQGHIIPGLMEIFFHWDLDKRRAKSVDLHR